MKGKAVPGIQFTAKAKVTQVPPPSPHVIQLQVDAAMVLPSPSPKDHAKRGHKGKDGKREGRSIPLPPRIRPKSDAGSIGNREDARKERNVSLVTWRCTNPVGRSSDGMCRTWKKDGKRRCGDKCKFLHHGKATPALKREPKAKPKDGLPKSQTRRKRSSPI